MAAEEAGRVVKLCDAAALGPGEVLRVCRPGEAAIAVVNVAGTFYALADECTHAEGQLSDGFVDEDIIVCPIHAGEFHIPSGKAMDFPVTEDARTYAVWVEDGAVMADLDRPSAHPAPAE